MIAKAAVRASPPRASERNLIMGYIANKSSTNFQSHHLTKKSGKTRLRKMYVFGILPFWHLEKMTIKRDTMTLREIEF